MKKRATIFREVSDRPRESKSKYNFWFSSNIEDWIFGNTKGKKKLQRKIKQIKNEY